MKRFQLNQAHICIKTSKRSPFSGTTTRTTADQEQEPRTRHTRRANRRRFRPCRLRVEPRFRHGICAGFSGWQHAVGRRGFGGRNAFATGRLGDSSVGGGFLVQRRVFEGLEEGN